MVVVASIKGSRAEGQGLNPKCMTVNIVVQTADKTVALLRNCGNKSNKRLLCVNLFK